MKSGTGPQDVGTRTYLLTTRGQQGKGQRLTFARPTEQGQKRGRKLHFVPCGFPKVSDRTVVCSPPGAEAELSGAEAAFEGQKLERGRSWHSPTKPPSSVLQAAAKGLSCYSSAALQAAKAHYGSVSRCLLLRPAAAQPSCHAAFIRTLAAPAPPGWHSVASQPLRRPGIPVSAKSGPRPRPLRRQAKLVPHPGSGRRAPPVFRRHHTAHAYQLR